MPGRIVEKDIPYADGGDQQKLDLYLPGRKSLPRSCSPTAGVGILEAASRSSRSVRNSRLSAMVAPFSATDCPRKDKFPAQIEDVAAAFAWVKRNIADKGGDPNQVFLMGHSSGRTFLCYWRQIPSIWPNTSSNRETSRASLG